MRHPLTHETVKLIFDYVNGQLIWKYRIASTIPRIQSIWETRFCGKAAGTAQYSKRGGPLTKVSVAVILQGVSKSYPVHRLVWMWHNIVPIPAGLEVDHRNRNPLDNRIENLRLATKAQNRTNNGGRSKRPLPRGVSIHNGVYFVGQLKFGKISRRKTFKTVEEADNFVRTESLKLCGEFSPYFKQE